jgi:hypothetical protein
MRFVSGYTDNEYIAELERKLEESINALYQGDHEIRHRPPDNLRPGRVVYADGVDWNPGLGEGLYRRTLANTWELVGNPVKGWRDITSEVKARGTGPTDPGWNQINTTGFWAYNFSIGDKVWLSFHLPHDYIKGTDVFLHSHWLPDGVNTNSVKWQFTYAYAHGHNQAAFNFGSPTVVTAEQIVGGTQYQHYVTESVAQTIAMEPDGILEVEIERITNGGTDNTDGIFLLTADVHFESNSIGTLNRSPDFYA